MNDLKQTLHDIAATGLNDPEREVLEKTSGPNDWANIKPSDFGTSFDFELYDHGDTTVFYPVSKAALQWGYRFLPEHCDRWRTVGFVIDSQYIDMVVNQAKAAKLVYLDDAMNEADEKQRQWE